MLDLARAAAGDKFVIIEEKFLKLYWWDSCKFSLTVTSVIITYLVAFSATNMHICHKVEIWHLMQAWARFALQCFSFILVSVLVIPALGLVTGSHNYTDIIKSSPIHYRTPTHLSSSCFNWLLSSSIHCMSSEESLDCAGEESVDWGGDAISGMPVVLGSLVEEARRGNHCHACPTSGRTRGL